jgi:hypothetical protein
LALSCLSNYGDFDNFGNFGNRISPIIKSSGVVFPNIWRIIPSINAGTQETEVAQYLFRFSARCEHACPRFPSANMEKEYPNARSCNASPLPASEDHSIPCSTSNQYETFWRHSMAFVGSTVRRRQHRR